MRPDLDNQVALLQHLLDRSGKPNGLAHVSSEIVRVQKTSFAFPTHRRNKFDRGRRYPNLAELGYEFIGQRLHLCAMEGVVNWQHAVTDVAPLHTRDDLGEGGALA